jgi:CRP-like cAMP-binding protein
MRPEIIELLRKTPLFKGVSTKDMESMEPVLNMSTRKFSKGETIFNQGDQVSQIGIVIEGRIIILKDDYWGNRNIVNAILPGQIFAESYACTLGMPLGVTVQAAEKTKIMLLNIRRLFANMETQKFPVELLRNLITLLAGKNIMLNNKLTHVTQRSTKEKLLSYLSAESLRQKANAFEIPFDRQQLADYLAVDRSAMSTALAKLQKDGVLKYDKNHFQLLHKKEY